MTETAFPVTTHLQDVSSQILNKIDSVRYQSLDSAFASTLLNELDEAIQNTKTRLHERIHSDLPKFQRQWESTKSIQTRLQTLTTNVDALNATVSDPNLGLVPVLLQRLSEHSELVREAVNLQAQWQTLSHVLRCKTELADLDTHVKAGRLPEAVVVLQTLSALLEASPTPLTQSKIFLEFRRKHQSTQALVQEQLSDAYSRSIAISPSTLVIRSSVQVRGSDTIISLPSILSSLTSHSLEHHLATLRRDTITHFIEHVLREPSSVSLDSINETEYSLSIKSAAPGNESKNTCIDNLSKILSFLSTHIFPILAPLVSTSFPQSLLKPTTTTLLNVLLIPSLPSSFGLLPPFLELAKRAVTFESDVVTLLKGSSTAELPIRTWVDGLAAHYEKQRRLELLGSCRTIILSHEDSQDRFTFEIEVQLESAQTNAMSVQGETGEENEFDDDAWGFDDQIDKGKLVPDEKPKTPDPVHLQQKEDDYQDDAWGFDDEDTVQEQPLAELEQPSAAPIHEAFILAKDGENEWEFDDQDTSQESQPLPEGKVEIDPEGEPGDVWGWSDDAKETGEDSNWDDDPWADAPPLDEPVVEKVATTPKVATRLEKLAIKAKQSELEPLPSLPPLIPSSSQYQSYPQNSNVSATPATSSVNRPKSLQTNVVPKESFTVHGKAKRIIKAVENLIEECKQYQASSLFPLFPTTSSSSQPGVILLQTATSLLDLYLAIYPVKFGTDLSESVQNGMLFANSCHYLAHEVKEIEKSLGRTVGFEELEGKLAEYSEKLTVVGESWYEQILQSWCEKVDDVLVNGAKKFAHTNDQDRYDECETAISQAVSEIRRFGQQLRGILTKGKYYTAIGLATEAALSRILEDILALSDIPEVDSHRLSELCRILNSLEGLFNEDPEQPSFVVAYVPSWLKFNYLSELLEASMADISYLFEEGALVDFEIDELVRLVKALFADTALRTNMINKLMNGHPVLSS